MIDGLDGMQIKGSEILTSYETTATVTTDAVNVINGTVKIENPIYHEDEDGLGRDYDVKLDDSSEIPSIV